MEISQVVGHSDRIDFTLYDLYPFVGKLGGCIYTEADAVDDKKYERVRKTITDFLQRGEDEEKDEQIGVTTVGTTMEIPPKTYVLIVLVQFTLCLFTAQLELLLPQRKRQQKLQKVQKQLVQQKGHLA